MSAAFRTWRLSCACGHLDVHLEAGLGQLTVTDVVLVGGIAIANAVIIGAHLELEALVAARPELDDVAREAWSFATEGVASPLPAVASDMPELVL